MKTSRQIANERVEDMMLQAHNREMFHIESSRDKNWVIGPQGRVFHISTAYFGLWLCVMALLIIHPDFLLNSVPVDKEEPADYLTITSDMPELVAYQADEDGNPIELIWSDDSRIAATIDIDGDDSGDGWDNYITYDAPLKEDYFRFKLTRTATGEFTVEMVPEGKED